MRTSTNLNVLFFGLVLSATLPAQILHYKFEEGGGDRVINYASGSGIAPSEGSIVSTNAIPFAAGQFGRGSLAGADSSTTHNYVDSGWTGPLNGSWSIAWFMKERTPLPNTLAYYFFSGMGSFRAFTSGAAGTGIRLGGFGGSDVTLSTDVRTPAATRWVHVACVVDAAAQTGTWYVDGVQQSSTATTGANLPVNATSFRVGMHTRLTTGSYWDIDEFRLVDHAATAAEVMAWATVDVAAESAFGAGCGANLDALGAAPALGSPLYTWDIGGTPNAPFSLAIGFSRTMMGAAPLPFDLGMIIPSLAGCRWESSADVFVGSSIGGTGTGQVSLPIPNAPSLVGVVVYSQAIVLGSPIQVSNPHASSVGH